jgi:hypothetical protein
MVGQRHPHPSPTTRNIQRHKRVHYPPQGYHACLVGWNIPGSNILIENHFVDARPDNSTRDSTISFPFNTDGFNLSRQNITVDGYWDENGDDCVSVVNGVRNIAAKVSLLRREVRGS